MLLILAGLVIGVIVFLAPLFMDSAADYRNSDRIVTFNDWGISIAAGVIGVGVLLFEMQGPWANPYYLKYRFAVSGFFFAIAGHRVFRRTRSWY
jgi:hypothetical protein